MDDLEQGLRAYIASEVASADQAVKNLHLVPGRIRGVVALTLTSSMTALHGLETELNRLTGSNRYAVKED